MACQARVVPTLVIGRRGHGCAANARTYQGEVGSGVGGRVGFGVGLIDGGMLRRLISSVGTSGENEFSRWIKKLAGSIWARFPSCVGISEESRLDSTLNSDAIWTSRPSSEGRLDDREFISILKLEVILIRLPSCVGSAPAQSKVRESIDF